MTTSLKNAKPGFYKLMRKDSSDPSGRAYGHVVLVTGNKSSYQPYPKSVQMNFIPLEAKYKFNKYSEGTTVKVEEVPNLIGFNAIFSR